MGLFDCLVQGLTYKLNIGVTTITPCAIFAKNVYTLTDYNNYPITKYRNFDLTFSYKNIFSHQR